MRKTTNFSMVSEEESLKYIETEDLEPLEHPEKDFKKCIAQLASSKEWSILFDACTIVRKVCKHHSHLILSQAS